MLVSCSAANLQTQPLVLLICHMPHVRLLCSFRISELLETSQDGAMGRALSRLHGCGQVKTVMCSRRNHWAATSQYKL